MIDANEIIRALKLWFQPGDMFEVRVLDAISADWMRPHTESGYFDYEHIAEVANAIAPLGNSVPIAEPMRQSIRSNRSCWPAPGTGFARFSKNRRPPIRKSLPDAGS